MSGFENGQRVIVTAQHHPLKGKAGAVVRLRRSDEAAWINMDDPIDSRFAEFPRGDARRNHQMFYPEECEPEPPKP